jgi:hypothetical protein
VRRVGVASTIVVAMSLIPAASALACLEPQGFAGPLAGGPPSYGPNDPTPFKITGTDEGAPYTVTVIDGGVPKASFPYVDADSAQGASGSFSMPDLGGSSKSVEIRFEVAHEGTTYPSTRFIQYVPPTPPGGNSPAPTPDAGGGHGTPAGGSPSGHQQGSPASPGQAPLATPAPGAPIAGSPAGVTEPQQAGESAGASVRAAEAESAGARAAADARAERLSRATAPERAEFSDGSTQVGPVAVPTINLIVMAVIFALGMGGLTGVFFVAGRLAPEPGRVAIDVGEALTPDAIEAELQEMISEARATGMPGDQAASTP